MGIKDMFSTLFATGADIEDDSDVKLTEEQKKSLKSIEEKKARVESPISESEQSKARKGLRKKYEAPNIEEINKNSQQNLEKMTEILKGKKEEKEIVD